MKPVTIIQGGQYGSEAKGMVAGALAVKEEFTAAVRTGAINAGHTVYYKGKPYKMQQLPVAWVNPRCSLFIGPGAYIHPQTLLREIEMVDAATGGDVRKRLYIDYRCYFHGSQDEADATKAGRHVLIGATGKGCAEAIISKIRDRGIAGDTTFGQSALAPDFQTSNVPILLMDHLRNGGNIMLEGTQGSLLDMHQGPYPYTTSRMTSPANWVAEAGLPVTVGYRLILVLRTYPIRVAGNSGPLPNETTWPALIRQMNVRLDRLNLPPIVEEDSIRAYEDALMQASPDLFREFALKPHTMTAAERLEFKVELSTVYADALRIVEQNDPYVLQDLLRVMEMTTVTKKPRRIAGFDYPTTRDTVFVERPDSIALTFLNYEFPETRGAISMSGLTQYGKAALEWAYGVSTKLGARVGWVSTGPDSNNLIQI